MIRALVLCTFFCLSASRLLAAETPPPAPATAPSPAPTLELKHRSSFKLDRSTRNPFWPIGWKPAVKMAEPGTDHAGPEIPISAFLVSSITVQANDRFAIINGRIMQEGQQFGLQMGNQTYQISVKTIEDGRVILARRDQEIVVLLRRK